MALPEGLNAAAAIPVRATDRDLDACAREPVHIPGAIQPFGALVAIDPATLNIEHASANLEQVLGHSADSLRGLLGADAGGIEAHDDDPNLRDAPLLLKSVRSPADNACFYVIAHRTANNLILEFEAESPGLAATISTRPSALISPRLGVNSHYMNLRNSPLTMSAKSAASTGSSSTNSIPAGTPCHCRISQFGGRVLSRSLVSRLRHP